MTFMLLAAGVLLNAVTVDPGKAEIVVDSKADGTVQFAALELQRHLQMATGKKIPLVSKETKGKYQFLMGTPAGVKLAPEEARWEITPQYTRIYGDSSPVGSPKISKEWSLGIQMRSGDLYVSGLVEDGMFEAKIYLPVAIYAETLWNCQKDGMDTVQQVMKYPCVTMANL